MGLAASKQEAFWEACGFGHVNRVRNFIEQGIDVNWISYTHNSSAIHVASQGKPEIVKMLIEAKCDINAKDDRGNLALHHAAMKGHAAIMQRLLDAGSEIDTQDKNGWTPLINAAYFCQPDAIALLVANNCDVNLMNKEDRTALHEACRSQSEDENGLAIIACHLVEAGSDINAKSSDLGEADFTPLMFASYHGHAEMVEVLAESGCEINSQGSNGWSALHWATDRGHREVVRVLIQWSIDPNLQGRRGELALDRAKDNELQEKLAKVTTRPKQERDDDGFVCHSPVSTMSPASSRRSSVSSLCSDGVTASDLLPVIDNDLAAVIQSHDQQLNRGNIDGTEEASVPGGVVAVGDVIETESTCTSGTISEKDEKETLEKDMSNDPPSSCCESLPEDGAISPTSEMTDEILGVAMTTDSTPNKDVSELTDVAVDLCQDADKITLSDKTETETESDTLSCNETSVGKDATQSSEESDTTESKQHPTQDTQDTASSNVQNVPDNVESSQCGSQITLSSPGDVEEGKEQNIPDLNNIALKKHPQIERLVAPSGGQSDTEDGNISDDLLGDGGFSEDLADSDIE